MISCDWDRAFWGIPSSDCDPWHPGDPQTFVVIGYVQSLVSADSLEILREHLDHKWLSLSLSRDGFAPSSSLFQTTALRLDQWSNRSEISCTYVPGICKNSLEIFRFFYCNFARKYRNFPKFLGYCIFPSNFIKIKPYTILRVYFLCTLPR